MRERDVLFSATLIFVLLLPMVSASQGLEVEDIEVFVNNVQIRTVDEDGGIVPVWPGDSIEVELTVENTNPDVRDKNARIDIDHARTTFTIKEIYHGVGVNDKTRSIDIDAGDEVTVIGNLQIPTAAKPGSYLLEIKIKGEDNNDNDIIFSTFLTVEVQHGEHSILVSSIEAPEHSACMTPVNVTLENIGEYTEIVNISLSAQKTELAKDVQYLTPQQKEELTYNLILPQGGEYVTPVAIGLVYDQQQEINYAYINVSCAQDTRPDGDLSHLSPSHTKNTYLTPIVEIHQQAVPDTMSSGAVFPLTFLISGFIGLGIVLVIFSRLI